MTDGTEINVSAATIGKSMYHYLVCGLLTLIILLFDVSIPRGVAAAVLYVAVVLLSFSSQNKIFTLLMPIICSLFTIVGFFLSPHGGEMWEVITNRGLSVSVIWLVYFLASQKGKLHQKLLRGILTICSSCKKIRDDKGYWNHIESFIKEHSEVDFSHSLCPECAQILYPDLYHKIQRNKK